MDRLDSGSIYVRVLLTLTFLAAIVFDVYYIRNNWGQDIIDRHVEIPLSGSGTSNVISKELSDPIIDSSGEYKFTSNMWIPANIEINKGDNVSWEVLDGQPKHQIICMSPQEEFTSPVLSSEGSKYSFRFDQPGKFIWRDKYINDFTGSISVTGE